MLKRKRILAIDVGKKRTGLAQSDPMFIIASPIGAFGQGEIFPCIEKLALESEITTFVVGWPIGQDGQTGSSTQMVQEFINRLKKVYPAVPIVLWDERFTSVMARRQLVETGVRKKKREQKGLVDATAACIILQEYLDQNKF
ncbi:MAG: Holliday junction resolvase RuvX [Balneolales bacterium]|nr:Holliday junction resolvase RuvX [Balneolales bacterium]